MQIPKLLSKTEVVEKLLKDLSTNDCITYIDGKNPCRINVNGEILYVYVKNITPAQLSNKNDNVWRVQLPKRKAFEEIKTSESRFILLGYDADCDVYATWNPYWTKQRLNVGESVSMYSRLSLQQEACLEDKIVEGTLAHDSKVIVFPSSFLPEMILTIDKYFPNETQYVAIGSSLRKGKDNTLDRDSYLTFEAFKSESNLGPFSLYIKGKVAKEHTVKNYIYSMRFLIANGLFDKYSDLFSLAIDESSYKIACSQLIRTEEVAIKDNAWHGAIRAALNHYVKFIFQKKYKSVELAYMVCEDSSQVSSKYSFIRPITNSDIQKTICELVNSDEPDYMEVLSILSSYYGDEYNDKMTISDWLTYAKNNNWER